MPRTSLDLPVLLKAEADELAHRQGVSLQQFILLALSEKIGSLRQRLDDARFPGIVYRAGAAGLPEPVLRGTGIRVRTLVVACQNWAETPAEIAADYDLSEAQVREALAFYEAHRGEIDSSLAEEEQFARAAHG